jgi:Hemerythrin HHE cation binding domain
MTAETYTDAIALLKAGHRKIEELFDKFERAKSGKRELAEKICTELKIHMMIEEEIFYPALKDSIEEDDFNEAFVEHDSAKVLINDIESHGTEDEFFDSKVHVMSEEVRHHVKEEEEPGKGIFWQARQSGADLVEMCDLMLARKEALMNKAKQGQLPRAKLTAVDASA